MTSLLHLLPIMLRNAGDSDELREQAVFAAWAATVGAQLRQVTTPVRLERKTLIIAVLDSTWKKQLKRMDGHTIFRLNSILGSPVITGLDYVVNEESVRRSQRMPTTIEFNAPEKQALPLREKAEAISNTELRETFLRAAGKCLDRRAK